MRRANDISDAELRDFCEWFQIRFKTSQQRQWLGQPIAAHHTRREWFLTSVEGTMHCPVKDCKKLLRRMRHLGLIATHQDSVELLKP